MGDLRFKLTQVWGLCLPGPRRQKSNIMDGTVPVKELTKRKTVQKGQRSLINC